MKIFMAIVFAILMIDTFQPMEDVPVKHMMRDGETLWHVVSETMKETKDPRTIDEVIYETRVLNGYEGNKLATLQSGTTIVIPCKRNKWF